MYILHLFSFRLQNLLVLAVVLPLIACSGGDGGLDSASSPTSTTLNILGLSWTAPSEREDGSGLSLSEIEGFRIYYGGEAGDYQNQFYISDSSAEQGQVINLPDGTYYAVITVVDTAGLESSYSSEVVITI